MTYGIKVEFNSKCPIPVMSVKLQELFDANGIDGDYLLQEEDGQKTIHFYRDAGNDIQYIKPRLAGLRFNEDSLATAAIKQLIAEMNIYDPPAEVKPIIVALHEGKASVDNINELLESIYY